MSAQTAGTDRLAAETSTEPVARYVPVGTGSVLVFPQVPAGAVDGVVCCPSLFSELSTNQRRERLLAQRLAERGIATVRFQPRGTLNALDGDDEVPTLDSVRADLGAAAAVLRDAGVPRLHYLGFRLGALVAATAAAADPAAALLLWDPVLSGADYLRQGSRADRVARLRAGDRAPDQGRELVGYPVAPWTERSLASAVLPAEIPGQRRIAVVVRAHGAEAPPALRALTDGWTAAGHRVDRRVLRAQQAWWFVPEHVGAVEEAADTRALVAALDEAVVGALRGTRPC